MGAGVRKLIRRISFVCLSAAVLLLIFASYAPDIHLRAEADSSHEKWHNFCQSASRPAEINSPGWALRVLLWFASYLILGAVLEQTANIYNKKAEKRFDRRAKLCLNDRSEIKKENQP